MSAGVAELIFRNGRIWTGDGRTGGASALAVRAGRVAAVGAAQDVAALVGRGTREVDLDGRALLPGFVDSHTHFLAGGLKLAVVSLRDADGQDELTVRIADAAARLAPGEWITGGDWDHERWGGELPRASWIDSVSQANPVFVSRLDLHMGLANALALKAGGITRDTPDPPGGTIERDPATGEPTGVLKDRAMELVGRRIPPPSDAELDRGLAAAAQHALSLGVTQVHDMGPFGEVSWRHLDTYRRAHTTGRLPLRVYCAVPLETWETLRDHVADVGWGDDRLWWGGLKGFVDGSLGSSTAWFHEPYLDARHGCGITVTDPAVLRERILGADAAGLHVIVHAIGDRANDWLLDVYGEAARQNGGSGRRFRIEHAQHLSVGAARRFGSQGVIASVQPYHLVDDGRWAEKRIGARRARTTYAFRDLLNAGATVAFGSDWTVAPLNPLPAVAAAVDRRTWDGSHPNGWAPEQKLSLEESLVAHTRSAAYAGWMEEVTGSLVPGAYADLVVLSGDPFTVPSEEIAGLRVEETYVEGELVYQRPARFAGRPD
jgi:predicted amidohydrolase YtcJ